MSRRSHEILLALSLLAVWAFCPCQGQEGSNQHYIVVDLFVASDGSVLFYGETNMTSPNLDPALGYLKFDDGHFSNTTDRLTSKVGKNWTLKLDILEHYSSALIKIYLPAGAMVMNATPSGWAIFQEKSGLVVTFYKSLESTDELIVEYQLGTPPPLDLGDYLFPLMLLAAVCLLTIAGAKLLWPRIRVRWRTGTLHTIDQSKMDAITPTLTDRERLVLEIIVKEGGRVSQRKLRHLSELPKSTLSRVTDELQRKGLIRKIPVGQTNELRLDERLFSEHT